MFNLLLDPLITNRTLASDTVSSSLPDLLVALKADEIADFLFLRPHQAPAWHVLLVQLATLALLKANRDALHSAEEWRVALRALTPGFADDEPWRLVVDDWTLPAFLQPPCTAASERAAYKREYASADALDVLVTSKNHDQKAERMRAASAEEWLYALVTLQTTEGFLGAGNYGIARMNGGFASRPVLRCAAASLGPGGQVFRDVATLLAQRDKWREAAHAANIGDRQPLHELLWLLPWNGNDSLSLRHLHPLAVEVCRRVRLGTRDAELMARSTSTKAARVDAKEAKGVLCDPWIPVERKETKAFTVTGEGFSYRRMVALLDKAQFERPLLANPTRNERGSSQSLSIHAAALARGQGKTEGFHSRSIVLAPDAAARFADDTSSFAQRAARFVELAAAAAGKALRPALIQLIQAKEDPDWKKPSNGALTEPWLTLFDAEVDRTFFGALSQSFVQAPNDEEAAEADWSRVLESLALRIFDQAANAAPRGDQRRILAQARASNLLHGSLKKHLPGLRARTEELADDTR